MRIVSIVACFGFLASSCGTNAPRYLDRGNKHFDAGQYEEAALDYRKAVQKNPRFGEAQYRLGLTELKKGNQVEAYRALSAAVDLLPHRNDIKVKLADLLLDTYLRSKNRPANLYQQLTKLSDQLMAGDPNSYDGLRIKGNLAWSDRKPKEAAEFFRRANASRPMEPDLILAWTQVLLQDGQFAEGERLALELTRTHKSYALIYDVLFRYYISQGRRTDAENILKTKVNNNPNEIEYSLQLASYYGASKREEMTPILQRLVGNPKAFPNARLRVGDFYSARQDWAEALRQYEEGARANPKERITYLKRIANAWLAQGKGHEATGIVAEIIKDQPNDESARAVNASLLLASGKPDQIETGLKEFKDLVSKSPDNPIWRFNLGQALGAKGDLAGASIQFQESIKRRKDFMPPRLALAELGRVKKDYNQTLRYADEILSYNPKFPQARLLHAEGLIGMQKYAEARSELVSLGNDLPQYTEVQFQVALLDLAEKRFRDAETRFQKLYADGKGDTRSLAGLVETYSAQNHLDKAFALLSGELKKSPDSDAICSLLGDTAFRSAKYDMALEQYQRLLTRNPRSANLQMRLGTVYELKGDLTKAIASFQIAKDLAPGNPNAAITLADALRLADRKPEAIASYRRALELEPDNLTALNNLAFLLADSGGSLDEAQKLAERTIQQRPREAHFADTLGYIYLKKKLGDSALQIFRELTEKYPADPVFHYHYGLALSANGQQARAKTELKTALGKSPPEGVRRNIESALALMSMNN